MTIQMLVAAALVLPAVFQSTSESPGQPVPPPAAARSAHAGAQSPVPIVLLRRSMKKAPNGSEDDVLVAADLTRDDIARRVAAMMAAPDGYGQFALRLDRDVKTYLASDPAVQGARRAILAEPAYLFLSDRQGGLPLEQFWLEMPDGSLREKRDVPFVDTVVGERDFLPGSPDGVEAIYAHELGHLIMGALAGPAPRRASNAVHFITVRTDAWTAFVEGYGEHVQPMSLDHDAAALWQASRDAPMPAAIRRDYERFAREQVDGCWICPANLAFIRWHGPGETWLRDEPIRRNQFAWRPALPAALAGSARPPAEVQMYRDVMPPPQRGVLKNGAQMLESEGVIATLFYRLASDTRLRTRYQDAAFYERFVPPGTGRKLSERGPQAFFTPEENVYLKMFDVFHTTFAWGDWPALDFVKAWAKRFPDDAGAVYDVFLDVTRGVTAEREAAVRHSEPGYLAGLRDRVAGGVVALDANLGAPLWITVPGFRLGMGLFRYVPVPMPFTVDLNAADEADLRTVPGVTSSLAAAIIVAREARGSFRNVDDLGEVPGVTSDLLAGIRDMRRRMQEHLDRQETRRSDSGWLKNYLVAILKGSYSLASAWQYGRAVALAGLVWILVWRGGGRLLRIRPERVQSVSRTRSWRRGIRAWAQGILVAAIPAAVAAVVYALGVLPSAGVMAGVASRRHVQGLAGSRFTRRRLSSFPHHAAASALSFSVCSSPQVNPSWPASASYSSSRQVLNIFGSSVLTVTGTPASNMARIGCAATLGTTPVRTLEMGHISSGIRRSARNATRAGSSMARVPCPMRSTRSTLTAPHTLSGPAASPACAVVLNPRCLASSKTGSYGSGGNCCSEPPMPIPTTPRCLTSSTSRSHCRPCSGPKSLTRSAMRLTWMASACSASPFRTASVNRCG